MNAHPVNKHKLITATLVGSSFALACHGQVTEAQRLKLEQKAAGTHNPLSFYDGQLVFDVQNRTRVEIRDNNFDFNDAVNTTTDDTWVLQRFRLGALVKPCPWFKAYVQGQDTREIDSRRRNVPYVLGAEGDDPFDLRQAFVELGHPAEFPLSARIGRQELIYGDERLIGAIDWNNFGRTFDAVKLRYEDKERKFWVDGFFARVVTIEGRGPSENGYFRFNESNENDNFAGLYASTTQIPIQTTEAYFLYRNKDGNDPLYLDELGNRALAYDIKQEVYTVGLRVKSLPGKLNGFDYEAEGAYQFGRNEGRIGAAYPNATGTSLEHSAFAFMARGGYTFEDVPGKPRLGVEYSMASGDSDPNDDQDDSFLNLFPTNHKFYGYMDLFAWKNIHNPVVSLKFAPTPQTTVQLDGHGFWLHSTDDAWYRANGVATVRPVNAAARDASSFVGTEFDLTVGYTPFKWLRFLAGYSHFFAGDYLADTQTAAAGDDDADFGYVQAIVSF